jgi:hypothetical protein
VIKEASLQGWNWWRDYSHRSSSSR